MERHRKIGFEWRNSLKDCSNPYWWKDERESRGEQLMGRKSSWSRIKTRNKGRGRPKITLVEVIIKDISIREVTESMNLDRI